MEEVQTLGIEEVMRQAIAHVSKNTVGYGLSLDLDGLDPIDAPGVGIAVPNGITAKDLIASLEQVRTDPKMLGVEIVEYNPNQDPDNKTRKVIRDLLKALFVAKSPKSKK
jgi:arginase